MTAPRSPRTWPAPRAPRRGAPSPIPGQLPNDLCGDGNEPKFSASADPSNTVINSRKIELHGVRGAHVADKMPPGEDCSAPTLHASSKPTAWRLTLGRPDVGIAVLDS